MHVFRSLLPLVLLAGCQNLTLPDEPGPPNAPIITSFTPHVGYAGDRIVVFGENFTDAGNILLFAGGFTALADSLEDGGGDVRLDGGLVFVVPQGLQSTEPLVLSNSVGQSDPSADDFVPLGSGHPVVGAPLASVRFRHAPVGLLDREENVLLASSLFDLVLTDGKAFERMPGRPLALMRSVHPDAGIVSVRTELGGQLVEVDDGSGAQLLSSEDTTTRYDFLLPPESSGSGSMARTIGTTANGQIVLNEWHEDNGAIVTDSARVLPFTRVLGAAASGPLIIVIAAGTMPNEAVPGVYSVDATAAVRKWDPATNAACMADRNSTTCQPPDGPVAIVPAGVGAPQIAVSLSSGDLLVLDSTSFTARALRLISYAPLDDLKPGATANKVVLTKSRDGALFQYDLATDSLDWSVQLRGSPTKIDVAASIDEIAVANADDNSVDTITASTGTWTGRIAFDLGLGSAPNHAGGIVAGYTYDTRRYDGGQPPNSNLDLLMRNIGLVVTIDASSLDVRGYAVLTTEKREALRLVMTYDFETLVVHREGIGLLETGSDGVRTERIVTTIDPGLATHVLAMPSGEIVLSTLGAVRVFSWLGSGATKTLSFRNELTMPAGTTLDDVVLVGNEVLVVTHVGSVYQATLYEPNWLRAGSTNFRRLELTGDLKRYVGTAVMDSGPTLFFADSSDGPVAWTEYWRTQLASSVIERPAISGQSPDHRYVLWIDEAAPEPTVRLVQRWQGNRADVGYFDTYSTYRLRAPASGPDFDPSGEWLYLPLTRLDQLDVVQ
ncbi:MAG: hypothetical protein QM817_23190 [Archangium sp.]